MALPQTLDKTAPADLSNPQGGAGQIRNIKLFLEDVFGMPDATPITAAGFAFAAGGLQSATFQDLAANPTMVGRVQRNSADLLFHDGSTARSLLTSSLYSYTRAGLPASPLPGTLARVTNDVRGIWAYQGSQWFGINGEQVNWQEFGAKGDGTTDDFAAIQAALDVLLTKSGTWIIPPGSYRITTQLSYTGNVGINVKWLQDPKAVIQWDGATGGTIIQFNQIWHSDFYNLYVDGGNKALRGVNVVANSSGCAWYNPQVQHCTGVGSKLMQFGDAVGAQVSEMDFFHPRLFGAGVPSNVEYGLWIGDNNVLNYKLFGGGVNACSIQSIHKGSAGPLLVHGTTFSLNEVDIGGNTGEITLIGVESEISRRWVSGAGGNPALLKVSASSFKSAVVPPDDIVISHTGQIELDSNEVWNQRTATSVPLISDGAVTDGGSGVGGILSRNNAYYQSTEEAPFANWQDPVGTTPFRYSSKNDYGGSPNAPFNQFFPLVSKDGGRQRDLMKVTDHLTVDKLHGAFLVKIPAQVAPTVTATGGTSNVSWGYKIIPRSYVGSSLEGPEGIATNGLPQLSASQYNLITWNHVPGAKDYQLYRSTVGSGGIPTQTGLIATTENPWFLDTGYAGDGATTPQVDESAIFDMVQQMIQGTGNPTHLAAPGATGMGRLYWVADPVTSKTSLYARFGTGAPQLVAVEP